MLVAVPAPHFQTSCCFVRSVGRLTVSLALPGVNGPRHPASGLAGHVVDGSEVEVVVVPMVLDDVEVVVAPPFVLEVVVVPAMVLEVVVVPGSDVLVVEVVCEVLVVLDELVVVVVPKMVLEVVVVVPAPAGVVTGSVVMLGLRTVGTPDVGVVWN